VSVACRARSLPELFQVMRTECVFDLCFLVIVKRCSEHQAAIKNCSRQECAAAWSFPFFV
jgi:hypothetical protein